MGNKGYKMKTGFLESISGNQSSSRLIGLVVVFSALVFAQEVLYFGRADVMASAAAAGTIFITVAGPAMAFLFMQKKQEIKQEKDETIANTDVNQITTP